MRPERWQAIEELYHSASDLPDGQRPTFLNDACAGDRKLFDEVESLLRYGSGPQSFLDTPAVAIMAKAIAADEFLYNTPSLKGEIVSHYRILEPIGRGGMGIVYAAEDLKLGRRVALKLLPEYLARDKESLRRFEREARAASALNHPNICTIHEIDEAGGLHFIAIELLEGETLKQRMARSRLSTKEILRIGIEICEALDAAHSAGIIHRDVKPANTFLTRRGTTKVLDFGVAKRVGPELIDQSLNFSNLLTSKFDIDLTDPGAPIGTLAYMSPEQVSGQSVDARSDIFSIGAVLYEMTTGQLPFPGKDATSVVRGVQLQRPIPVEQINPRTPSALVRFINKAMEKDRSARYQHIAELRADLQGLQSRLERKGRWRQAIFIPLALVAALAILIPASLRNSRIHEWIAGRSSTGIPVETKSVAVLPFENLTGDPSQDYFVDGMTDALIAHLTKLGSLRVISRTSSMHYKGTRKTIPEVARDLNVSAIVEGSVERSADHVRISAQLVDAANDRTMWSRDYSGELADVLELQSELAAAVAVEVAGKLTPQEQARFAHGRSVKPEVYDAYLKGRYFLNRLMEEDLKKGVGYFNEAIRLDPDYAPAYSGLADAYSFIGFVGVETDRPQQLALEAAKKAISLDDSLAEAHASLGWVLHRHFQDWTGAEKEYRRAIDLNPSYATAHRFYGIFRRGIGLDAPGCEELRIAHELDPLNPLNTNRWAECLFAAGKYDEAVHMVKDNLEIDPNNLDSLWTLGGMYERRGTFSEALDLYQKALDATDGKAFIPYALLASAYGGSGQSEKAEEILREMKQKFGEDNWIAAFVHVRMGLKEQAIRELTEDLANDGPGTSGPGASLYVSEWRFDPLRSDPRFQALLRKFNYPESAFRK
jgi:TolB-like protein/Flp pilus assembly protein TadD